MNHTHVYKETIAYVQRSSSQSSHQVCAAKAYLSSCVEDGCYRLRRVTLAGYVYRHLLAVGKMLQQLLLLQSDVPFAVEPQPWYGLLHYSAKMLAGESKASLLPGPQLAN